MVRAPDSHFVTQVRAAYDHSVSCFLWKQAAFYAERLVAESPSDESTYLLALAFFHNQDFWRARWHLQACRLPEARYLLAKCCFQLRRWEEAAEALLLSPLGLEVVHGAAGLFLLGQIKEQQCLNDQAVDCYAKCLETCPFMWEAYERWSWLILGLPSPSRSSTASMASTTFTDERLASAAAALAAAAGNGAPSSPVSPGAAGRGEGGPRASHRGEREPGFHSAAPRKSRLGLSNGSGGGGGGGDAAHPPRRSLAGGGEGAGGGGGGGDGAGEASLAQVLQKLGLAVHALHAFEGGKALQLAGQLPRRHYETGYVLHLAGRCHFESADYKKAEEMFQQVWRDEPQRTDGLETYSTTLWHLKKDIELGALAQHFLQGNRLKPEVWCVVGNCFSLQKEHDTAIKFFKRAIQVDPSFVYAYTMCGHEYRDNEKFDKAIPMYEHALSIDPRHYNAWFGLGEIYRRQEEYANAEYHFQKALEIHRNHSVLRCSLGTVLDALNNPEMALEHFSRATQGESPYAMAYFHKACVLMSMDRYEEALTDLKKVRCLAPKEACVHFELGKVYMKLDRHRKALDHFNIAMDLNRDSKENHIIRNMIEELQLRGIKDPDPIEAPVLGRQRRRVEGGGALAHARGAGIAHLTEVGNMQQMFGSSSTAAAVAALAMVTPTAASASAPGVLPANGSPQAAAAAAAAASASASVARHFMGGGNPSPPGTGRSWAAAAHAADVAAPSAPARTPGVPGSAGAVSARGGGVAGVPGVAATAAAVAAASRWSGAASGGRGSAASFHATPGATAMVTPSARAAALTAPRHAALGGGSPGTPAWQGAPGHPPTYMGNAPPFHH